MMIQTMLGAQAFMPHGVAGVTTSTRRITWKGHSVSIRVLRPAGDVRGVYVDYHGGGWAIGTAAMDDRVNARIAADCGLVVVSVDYTTLPDIDLPGMIAQRAAGDWAFEHAREKSARRTCSLAESRPAPSGCLHAASFEGYARGLCAVARRGAVLWSL
jgi:acetyl esterase/lipase